uniref:Uncharacterized protein n=1 Tax=Rhizophora mucronata TaxID=61149 RepID=A0A2P2P4X4_RHIMU
MVCVNVVCWWEMSRLYLCVGDEA